VTRNLTLVHTRTLRMADDVLAVACSPNGKVRVFVRLYIHCEPVCVCVEDDRCTCLLGLLTHTHICIYTRTHTCSHTHTHSLSVCLWLGTTLHLQLLAVSLLDATVKVFYMDSLKFFLSLYGHKARTNA
jgi:hypothetical protein